MSHDLTAVHNKQKKGMHETWTLATKNYSEHIEPHFSPLCEAIIEEIKKISPKKCLDIASGAGEPAMSIAQYLENQGVVYGTDLCESMVKLASQRCLEKELNNCSFQIADAENLSNFESAMFDVVTCRQGIGFFPNVEKAISEFHRVLTDKGSLILTSWGKMEDSLLPRISGGTAGAFIEIPPNKRKPWHWAEGENLKVVLENVGFGNVKTKYIRTNLEYDHIDDLYNAIHGTAMRRFLEQAGSIAPKEKIKEKLADVASAYKRADGGYSLKCGFIFATAVKQT